MNWDALISQLYWNQVHFLWLIGLPVLMNYVQKYHQKKQWQRVAQAELQPWIKAPPLQTSGIKNIFILSTAWLLFVVALAGPRIILNLPPHQQKPTDSLVIIIDNSSSMSAEDEQPNRKLQAIRFTQSLIEQQPSHLKIGFIVFAGHSFSIMPPSNDQNIVKHFVKTLSTLQLPTLGNNLTSALELALKQFDSPTSQHILILSDGDLSPEEQTKAEDFLSKLSSAASTQVSIIGFGYSQAVKINNASGQTILENGRPILSQLNSKWFHQLEQDSHADYQHFYSAKNQQLTQLIHLERPLLDEKTQQQSEWTELFHYPLLLALFLLFISLWNSNKTHSAIFQWIGITLLLSYQISSTAEAKDVFYPKNSLEGIFNKGITCYRAADFHCAIRSFSQVAWQARRYSKQPQLQAFAVFNLANSYFYLAEYQQASILYQDASNLGFDKTKANKNKQFAESLQAALLRQIKDIKATLRRAQWRANMLGEQAPSISDILASGRYLAHIDDKNITPTTFKARQAIKNKIAQALGQKSNYPTATQTQWIKTETIAPQTTSDMLKRLFELELSLPSSLQEPLSIEGKRTW